MCQVSSSDFLPTWPDQLKSKNSLKQLLTTVLVIYWGRQCRTDWRSDLADLQFVTSITERCLAEIKAETRISVCSTKTMYRNVAVADTIHQASYIFPTLSHADQVPSAAPNRAAIFNKYGSSSNCDRDALCGGRLGYKLYWQKYLWSSSVPLNQGWPTFGTCDQ